MTTIHQHPSESATPNSHVTVSVITTCKGRLHHLRESLPMMLAQQCSFEYEVIVVDYGCPDGTYDWCRQHENVRLVALRVSGETEFFNLGRARNCGANLSAAPVLAFVDADMLAKPTWLADACGPVVNGTFGMSQVQRHAGAWDRNGTWAVQACLFHESRGYDEEIEGWGPEDGDICDRVRQHTDSHYYSIELLDPIRHNNIDRTRFYREKSIRKSASRIKQYLAHRAGEVNPNGYGIADVEVARANGPPTRKFIGNPLTAA